MDRISAARRSENMRRIKSKNTKPEMVVRKALRSLGYGYRLHSANLPGKPDLVFNGRRKVIFVHGCFWHQHENCRDSTIPASRPEYWHPKLSGNVDRDRRNQAKLAEMGWQILTIWDCETKNEMLLKAKLDNFLRSSDDNRSK